MVDSRAAGPATRAERFSWCLFDFANSAFNTIVLTFVYATFFASVLARDEKTGGVQWARALTVSGLLIAVLSPVLGTLADQTAHKKRYLVVGSLFTIVCTALLFLPTVDVELGRASDSTVWLALGLVVLCNVGFEVTFVFYNAFLPGLTSSQYLGRLSGYGWAFGYVGGLVCLVLCLGMIGKLGGEPWLPSAGHVNIRATNLLVAGWFLLFALPMFFLVRDHTAPPRRVARVTTRQTLARMRSTLGQLPHYPDLLRLLVARLFYNDALVAMIGLSGIYMATTLGMAPGDIMAMGVMLNVVAGVGALGFGFIDDFVGAKAALVGSLVLLLAGAVLAVLVPTPSAFTAAAVLVGLGMGPNQAASRTMLARFIDPYRSAEFYGLYALSGKATVWLGPLLFGVVLDLTGSQRTALVPLIAMFAVGLVVILTVDERRGVAAATPS